MSPRWFAGLAATVLMMLTLTPALADSDLWLHVRVDEEDGARVRVNVPLALVEKTAPLIPEGHVHGGRVIIHDVDMEVEDLRELWQELKESPEMTFVTVEEEDERVEVSKRGGYLVIRVEEHDEDTESVDVRIPERVVDALLSGEGDELDLHAAIVALVEHGEGELVTVADGEDHVRIWVDRSAAAE